jgi:hypothetical protein
MYNYIQMYIVGPLAQSVYQLTTVWTFRESNPGRGEIPPVRTGHGVQPASCIMGTRSFQR